MRRCRRKRGTMTYVQEYCNRYTLLYRYRHIIVWTLDVPPPPPSLTHACGGPIGIFFFLKDIAIKLFGCTRFLFFYFCVFWRPGLKALFLNQFYSYCSGSDGLARYYALIASFIYYPCKN